MVFYVFYDGLESVDLSGSTITSLVFDLPVIDDQAVLEARNTGQLLMFRFG